MFWPAPPFRASGSPRVVNWLCASRFEITDISNDPRGVGDLRETNSDASKDTGREQLQEDMVELVDVGDVEPARKLDGLCLTWSGYINRYAEQMLRIRIPTSSSI